MPVNSLKIALIGIEIKFDLAKVVGGHSIVFFKLSNVEHIDWNNSASSKHLYTFRFTHILSLMDQTQS